jgi:hypothetical protein
MTIQMTFDSFDDMKDTILRMAGDFLHEPDRVEIKAPAPEKEALAEMVKEVSQAPVSALEQPAAIPGPVKEVDRVEMRKLLSVLNKTTGTNTARELINAMGFKALTSVPDDRLAELKAKAEEVLNAN